LRMQDKIVRMPKSNGQVINCPKCGGQILFFRAEIPIIDSAGFETYTRKCNWCGVCLCGVIDPYDDTFLATAIDQTERT